MRLFNTESRSLEELVPHDGKRIKMYTCGPTVYDYAHIGNFRTYVAQDLLRRTLEFFDIPVLQAMNITDVDDKTIGRALKEQVPLRDATEPYRIAFMEDLKTLNILPAHHYPKATDYIPQMIELIQTLLAKKIAYAAPDHSIYYSTEAFQSYGRLSHLNLDELKANASGDNDPDCSQKRHAADFVLWKAYDSCRDGTIFWESPFGRGRPGWHIECSAMAMQLLGHSLDLHAGGIDLMFPHHENEIAQSEGCTACRFVRYWFHVEHLLVDHRKMSKSLGNFYTLRDLLKKGYTGSEVRYLLLSTHYRTQLNFTDSGLDAARASLKRVRDLIDRLRAVPAVAYKPLYAPILDKADLAFREALSEDLNISVALSALFDLIRDLHTLIDQKQLSQEGAQAALSLLNRWDRVLGVLPLAEEQAPADLLALLQEREAARKAKNWAESDRLRNQIAARGYQIEDSPTGARLKRSS